MEKLKLKYPVIVEGKYDKIKLDSIISSTIIVLDGFSFFNNKDKQQLIRRYARNGAIILTDSDKAGEFIRNRLKGIVGGELINLYAPAVLGKEKRKTCPSKDGILGIEGIDADILRKLLKPFEAQTVQGKYITKQRLFSDGLLGSDGSAGKRKKLLESLDLPPNLTTNSLCDALNSMIPEEKYTEALEKLKKGG